VTSWRFLPNALTLARIAMVFPTVWSLHSDRPRTALALVVAAACTDALDGALARTYEWRSRVGAILDPLADKLLLVSLYGVLAWLSHLPVWLSVLVIARDLVIVGGAVAFYALYGAFEMRPSGLGKLNTAVQLALLGVVIGRLAGLPFPPWLVGPMIWLTAVVAVLSGVDYVLTWGRRALAARPRG
jgi:cardiolipin synthase